MSANHKSKNQAEEMFKSAFDQVSQSMDSLTNMSKTNFDAIVNAAGRSAKCAEEVLSELMTYSRHNMEAGVSAAKEMANVRSVDQLVSLQTQFSKQYFEDCVKQMTRLSDMMMVNSKNIVQPLNECVSKATESVFKKKAA